MLKLLESGKDVVTANKALLAEHGPELFDRARKLGRSIAFEAAVAGGIPIIATISQCLSANQIRVDPRHSQRHEQFHPHADGGAAAPTMARLVAEAQQRGYAEADPTMDVDGSDAAQKLAILAHLAFGVACELAGHSADGHRYVDVADMRYAKELGYSIKLLAVAELAPEGLELHVSPTLVRSGTPLAEVRGAYNAIAWSATRWGRCCFTAWRRADADGLGRRRRPDRHGRRPHGDHVPHVEALVDRDGRWRRPPTRRMRAAGSICDSTSTIGRA